MSPSASDAHLIANRVANSIVSGRKKHKRRLRHSALWLSWGVSAEQKHTAQHNSTGTAQVARDLPPETYDWSEAGFKWQWADGWLLCPIPATCPTPHEPRTPPFPLTLRPDKNRALTQRDATLRNATLTLPHNEAKAKTQDRAIPMLINLSNWTRV
ncbi:hypothetical protein HZ326_0702 [Fusarium oxysporum f. sp. albedinis]|nr:hypothetical protein HZ326_0702 [Fusarium oxysporum f. sp. albedinis]